MSKLDKVINWELFRNPIEKALYVEPKGAGGRPAYDKLMMFKILILQKYYNLSDEQAEFRECKYNCVNLKIDLLDIL